MKLSLAGRSGTRPIRGRVEEKIGEKKTRYDSVDPTRLGKKPGCNPLIFIFLLKQRCFDFKKIKNYLFYLKYKNNLKHFKINQLQS